MMLTKNMYLAGFAAIVAVLAVVRCVFPSVAEDTSPSLPNGQGEAVAQADATGADSASTAPIPVNGEASSPAKGDAGTRFVSAKEAAAGGEQESSPHAGKVTKYVDAKGKPVKHRILSVSSYDGAFPDNNDVQLEAAAKHGVKPVASRKDAERRMDELVYVGACPYYKIDDRMRRSIPYLVPRAAVLLNDMGRAYYDSLQLKGIPLHQFIVTSVLRTQDDVERLRVHNTNATTNSCHLYGTTFDICYNRYRRVNDPDEAERSPVRNDTLKWVLSEVLEDMRLGGRCYIKYEKKQSCFHITVR